MSKVRTKLVKIVKADAEKRIVYGLVYAPNVIDSAGEFMGADDIEAMAHRFMQLDLSSVIDTNHDEVANGCYPVESYIAREDDPLFPVGSWVLGVKCTDDMWQRVLNGEVNSYSFEAFVQKSKVSVEITSYRDVFGETEEAEDMNGVEHSHVFFAHVNELGRVTQGWTDEVSGHRHKIKGASKTVRAADGHSHRFFL